MINIIFIVLIVVSLVAIIFQWFKSSTDHVASSKEVKRLFDNAVCFLNEQTIMTRYPVPLHGKPDQVLRLEDGRLVVLDTKNRERVIVYFSDLVQLSVYAVILKNQGHKVCPYGVIRIPHNPLDEYRAVKLLKEKEVVALYHRYQAIKAGDCSVVCNCGKH